MLLNLTILIRLHVLINIEWIEGNSHKKQDTGKTENSVYVSPLRYQGWDGAFVFLHK